MITHEHEFINGVSVHTRIRHVSLGEMLQRIRDLEESAKKLHEAAAKGEE